MYTYISVMTLFVVSASPLPILVETPQARQSFYVTYGKNVMSAQMLEVSGLGVGTVLRLERDAWSIVK